MTEQKVDLGSALYVGTKVHYLIYQITNFVLRQNCPHQFQIIFHRIPKAFQKEQKCGFRMSGDRIFVGRVIKDLVFF